MATHPLETRPGTGRALGVDSAGRLGWVGVLVGDDGYLGASVGSLTDLIAWAEPLDVIGIDIPIGLSGRRACDSMARALIGPRRSSVFPAPPARVLEAGTYHEANEALVAQGAPKMSKQAWALVPKIKEAATVAAADPRVYEVHPEVSFCAMAGEQLMWAKKSWNGVSLRRRLLKDAGILLPDVVEPAGAVSPDDMVDAAAAAWSAHRIALRTARSLPDPPEDIAGRPVAIWY